LTDKIKDDIIKEKGDIKMRKLYYKNNDTREVTASYNVAKEWKNRTIFFEDITAPKGQEELELEEESKELKKKLNKKS
jgi:hypothetical protein